jgi:hypothetical protein
LLEERANRDFDSEENQAIFNILDSAKVEQWRDLMKPMVEDPELANHHSFYEMDRGEMWIHHMQKFNRAW